MLFGKPRALWKPAVLLSHQCTCRALTACCSTMMRRMAVAMEPGHGLMAGIAAGVLGFLNSPQEALSCW